ncbi:Phosphopyruvate hydratase [Chthoniobacter flavus Ellin428]|uniref:Enolase n=1 Tax=Chthoniobacter flavus Ellin428 TaxID=497964 RepID=B4D7J4_9BACT|nr:phosphopyruvate hydratase [Chthoniobacter flavus]EDY17611.1 Phosphopyruvate hydratase [Chthoniobacter flavus Ellin428]TCO92360.1 enolase [Chthoniobacter flavus]
MKISSISAYQVFDSRGNPTVEAEVVLENGVRGRGTVPSGASTGQFEALELRDRDVQCFRGKSVLRAIANVQDIIRRELRGRDVFDQAGLDQAMIELDGTPNKSRLGANAILGVSMAATAAAASARGEPLFAYLGTGDLLPLPEIQITGGGAHANWRTDVQDYLLIATGARSYAEVMEITHNVYHAAGDILKRRGSYFGVADEGGYWPEFKTNEEPLQLLVEAIKAAGYEPGRDAVISLDVAASDLFDEESGTYQFGLEQRRFSTAEFAALIEDWCARYPIISLEDPMADTDWEGWQMVFQKLGRKIQLIGDDLFTTNIHRIRTGIEKGIANAVLIKLNQIGTVTETLEAIRTTQQAGWLPVVSARSGETEDTFISHLAVAANAGQLKVGSFSRSERMAKWNEVIRIERALGERARFVGSQIFETILPGRNEHGGG